MDPNSYPSLQSLAKSHAQLAVNSRRVERVVDSQLDGIERLFQAATSGNWESIAQASRFLAKQDPAHLNDQIIRHAQQLCDELAHSRARPTEPKSLANLIEACRSSRQQQLR